MLTKKVTSLILASPLAQRRGKVVNWFQAREATSPDSSCSVHLKDLPMTEEYRQTFWQLIDRSIISESDQTSQYFLQVNDLERVLNPREWMLLDIAAAIFLVTLVWMAYIFLPFLPFFG